MDRNLIYDLGLHRGYDSEYYLKKGFKVIALEANSEMIRDARNNPYLFETEQEGKFGIVPLALWHKSGEAVPFYVNSASSDWSSLQRNLAEKGSHKSEAIRVVTTTLADMFDRLGLPYYIKCDIEGAEVIFSEQLAAQKEVPAFVSCEEGDPRIIEHFGAAGYDCFQIVNQARHNEIVSPNPSREGNYYETQFTGHMSGLFGLDLPFDRWISYDEVSKLLRLYRELSRRKFPFSDAWFDIHATKKETLVDVISRI